MNDYSALNPQVSRKAVQQYVELLKEIKATEARLRWLNRTRDEHKEFDKELWITAAGEILIVSDIDDKHLVNIVAHCAYNDRSVPSRIEDEIYKRGLVDQSQKVVAAKIKQKDDEDVLDLDDIPF